MSHLARLVQVVRTSPAKPFLFVPRACARPYPTESSCTSFDIPPPCNVVVMSRASNGPTILNDRTAQSIQHVHTSRID
eukprot:616449-Pyramimonas_sp.AAC.1